MAIAEIRPDWTIGTLNLTSGSTAFTTTGSMLQTAAIQAGDSLITESGLVLVIATITGQNAGTLMEPCPAGAAGAGQPLRVRFQPDGSRYNGATADLVQLLGSGNVYEFAGLQGVANGVPVFTGAGTMEIQGKDTFVTPDPNGNLAELSGIPSVDNLIELGLLPKQNDHFIVMGNDGSVETLSGDTGYSILGNIPDAFISTTLPQAKAYRRGNAVGNVSQVDGVPTGALIQRGSNSNGQFARFADGTQICWHTIMAGITTATVGSLFMTSGMTWTFPSAFSDRPTIGGACYKISGGGVTMLGGPLGTPSTTAMNNIRGVSTHTDSDTELFIFAMGRWY